MISRDFMTCELWHPYSYPLSTLWQVRIIIQDEYMSAVHWFFSSPDSTCRFELVASNSASMLQIAKRPPGIETWPAFMKP